MRHWHRCERWDRRGISCPFGPMDDPNEQGGEGEGDEFCWDCYAMVPPERRRKGRPPKGQVMEAAEMVRLAVQQLRALKETIRLPSPGVIPEPRTLRPPVPVPGPGIALPGPNLELFPQRVGSVFGGLLQTGIESFTGYRSQYEANRLAGELEESLAEGFRNFVGPRLKPIATGAALAGGGAGMGFLFNWSARLRRMQGVPSMEEEFGSRAVTRGRSRFDTGG